MPELNDARVAAAQMSRLEKGLREAALARKGQQSASPHGKRPTLCEQVQDEALAFYQRQMR